MSQLNQLWFEMERERRRSYAKGSWIPLREFRTIRRDGTSGHLGFVEDLVAVGTLAVPLAKKAEGERLSWSDIGTSHDHRSWSERRFYVPADIYAPNSKKRLGVRLVLAQGFDGAEPSVWHLHQDLVIALELLREGDNWLRPAEGYTVAAKLTRAPDGRPCRVEMRTELLLDYLCARHMGLALSAYQDRTAVVGMDPGFSWPSLPKAEIVETGRDRWEGRVSMIHAGGMPYGSKTAVLHVGRNDIGMTDDVPELGAATESNTWSETWEVEEHGERLFRVEGQHWHDEWIAPGASSPRVRGDDAANLPTYIVDAAGNRESAEELKGGVGWLWFRASVIPELLLVRGAALGWHTADTAAIGLKGTTGLHFGVNEIGHINVFASDVAELPEWVQRIVAGHNVGPDGGVCGELLDAQLRAMPASTVAPEERFVRAIGRLEVAMRSRFGVEVMARHDDRPRIEAAIHRFRVRDRASLFALAKDIARLTADSILVANLHKIVAPANGEKWGSLKSLEKVLATVVPAEDARGMLTALVGTYELRLADAHLPSSEVEGAFALAGIDGAAPSVQTGKVLVDNCATALERICGSIELGAQASGKAGV